MSYNMISAFDYEIKNKIDLELENIKKQYGDYLEPKMKGYDDYEWWTMLKEYMEERIEEWKAVIKAHEDKMLNSGR